MVIMRRRHLFLPPVHTHTHNVSKKLNGNNDEKSLFLPITYMLYTQTHIHAQTHTPRQTHIHTYAYTYKETHTQRCTKAE